MSWTPLLGSCCPETGMPVRRRRAWTNVPLTPRYSASFALVGDRVLFSAPCGDAGYSGMARFLEVRERVLREVGLWDAPHVEVKSYDEVSLLHPPQARQQFADAMQAEVPRGQLRGFWGFGGPIVIRFIMRVAKQRILDGEPPIPIDFVRNYRAALLAAVNELERHGLAEHDWRTSVERGWSLETARAAVRYRLVAEDVLHIQVRGDPDEEGIEADAALMTRVLDEARVPIDRPFYQVRDVRLAAIPSRPRRELFLDHQRRLARRRAYGGVAIFGLPALGRLLARAGRRRIRAPVLFVTSFAEALAAVEQLRRSPPGSRLLDQLHQLLPQVYTQRRLEEHISELLAYASAINFGLGASQAEATARLSDDNPFKTLHAALSVLETDFNSLLARNEAAQAQLARAATLASLGTLTAGLAHELNSPLTAVSGYAQRLARHQDDKVGEQAAAILRSAGRMRAVIGQLGPGSGRLAGPREPLDLGHVLREVRALLQVQLERHEVQLRLRLPAQPLSCRGDRTALQSALTNIVVNACHALAEQTSPRRIELAVSAQDGNLVFTCDDNGPGMSDEIRQRAVDPFYTTKSAGQGSGMGLFLAHRIIEAHGGVLHLPWCERGCRVEVRLPALDAMDPSALA
jgi:signal transduction histidine kinase